MKEKLNRNCQTDSNKIFRGQKLASYKVAFLIAKKNKYFNEGEFVKKCITEICDCIFSDKPAIKEAFEKIPLSKSSMTRRIKEISLDIENSLQLACKNCKFFSLCLDESNDLLDIKQLVIFIRGVNEDFEIFEEMLDLVPLDTNSESDTIFEKILEVFHKFDIDLNKIISITVDGARNLSGVKNGLVVKMNQFLKANNIDREIITFHCIIHQENLFVKKIELDNVISLVDSTVKKLKKSGSLHRYFKNYLDDFDSLYSAFFYFTEVRWLSRGKFLKRFFELLYEVDGFLDEQDIPVAEFSDINWKFKLAFLVDLTSLLNKLNTILQGKAKFIIDMMNEINDFTQKLRTYIEEIAQGNFLHFFHSYKILEKNSAIKESYDLAIYVSLLEDKHLQFSTRFSDFRSFQSRFDLFLNPFQLSMIHIPEQNQNEFFEFIHSGLEDEFKKCLNNKDKIRFF